MKKSFLMLGLAVAAMSSCTNDEVIDLNQSNQKAIGFESFVNKGTRAVTETTTPTKNGEEINGLSQFYVFGYYNDKVEFDNVLVTGSIGSELTGNNDNIIWDYAGDDIYWTNNDYYFAAYANKNVSEKLTNVKSDGTTDAALSNASFANQTLTISNYEVDDNEDLIASVVSCPNTNLSQSVVSFNFKHLLAKIQFSVKNTSNYNMRIVSKLSNSTDNGLAGLAITGVENKGNIEVTANGVTYSPSSTSERENFIPISTDDDATYDFDSNVKVGEIIEPNETVMSETYFVMPQSVNGTNVQFKIRAQFLDRLNRVIGEKELVGNLAGATASIVEWEAGYSYVYQISLPIAAKPIKFDVSNFDGFTPYSTEAIELNSTPTISE